MICGNCQSKKTNILTVQSYQAGKGTVTIYHIPATQCNCTLYISNSVNQEIREFLELNGQKMGTVNMSYSDV